ncbi:MAG: ATP-binding protein [Chitinophagales bacterium]
MKNVSSGQIAFTVSSILALLTFLLSGVLFVLSGDFYKILALFLIPIVVYALSYLLLKYFIDKFIYRKIKLIYKTIHSLKTAKSKVQPLELNADLLEGVEKEVIEWSKGKTQEIQQLKDISRFRKEFIGNVSHELKTPIFAIQGYLHTLIDGGLEDDKINKNYLYKASKNLDRLNKIVEDLDVINRFETNTLVLEKQKFDIVELIKDVFDSLEMQADLKDIVLKFKDPENSPKYVKADKEQIRQVMVNLLSNSIKYGKEEGQTLVGIYDMDENYLVEITDNGIGIAEDNLDRLFERFFRVDKSRARDMGGTGLGLAIVKHIIEAHGQVINVRSKIGVGSTFGFTLKKV